MSRIFPTWIIVLCALAVSQQANAGFFLPLGHLPNSEFSSAADVSDDGTVVVGLIVGSSFSSIAGTEAFRWTSDEEMVGLGIRPGNLGSYASAVSSDGSVIVGGNHNGFMGCGCPAFRWTSAEGMMELGDLPGGYIISGAHDVSADGSVVVGWSSASTGDSVYAEAFRWTTGGGMVGLGNLTGGDFDSQASGVSEDGSVIVGYSDVGADFEREAFRWTSTGGMVGLGDLPGGQYSSSAADVSADGSVVVGWATPASGQEAFVWDAIDGMRSVSDVLRSLGVDLTGWSLWNATAISADGTIIVGNGLNPSGQTEAWLANISPVPEPSALGIAGIAVFGLLARRRRTN